jgi:hypothetical protein
MGECIDKRIPWFSYAAIEKLPEFVKGFHEVLEWGAGGSTLWWLDQGCEVTTIEHDRTWVGHVRTHVRPEQAKRWHSFVVEAERSGHAGYASRMRPGLFFQDYAKYPATLGRKYDVICVDGRARPACMLEAPALLRSGGLLILDNSDRATYAPSLAKLVGWHRMDFFGPGPESSGVQWMTTFAFKPES